MRVRVTTCRLVGLARWTGASDFAAAGSWNRREHRREHSRHSGRGQRALAAEADVIHEQQRWTDCGSSQVLSRGGQPKTLLVVHDMRLICRRASPDSSTAVDTVVTTGVRDVIAHLGADFWRLRNWVSGIRARRIW